MSAPEPQLSLEEQKKIILNILADFCTDADELPRFLGHVGYDIGAISHPSQLIPSYLGHCRLKTGTYDVDRACNDLATWPPIAAEIRRLIRKKGKVLLIST